VQERAKENSQTQNQNQNNPPNQQKQLHHIQLAPVKVTVTAVLTQIENPTALPLTSLNW
jgi:hypothetical protein